MKPRAWVFPIAVVDELFPIGWHAVGHEVTALASEEVTEFDVIEELIRQFHAGRLVEVDEGLHTALIVGSLFHTLLLWVALHQSMIVIVYHLHVLLMGFVGQRYKFLYDYCLHLAFNY